MSNWQSLSVFIAVAEEGSFSGAAKRLELTQPTVSFHIDSLEKRFGCPLFLRTARGASLTVYGEALYHNTRKISTLLEETQNQIKAMLAGASGKITFGASTIPAEYILPGIMADFLAARPGIQFTLRTGDSQSILAAFDNGDFPIAIVGVNPGENYHAQPCWQDEMILVGHPDLVSRIDPGAGIDEISKLPFVTRSLASGSMRTALAALEQHGVPSSQLKTVMQVSGNQALKSAIISKAGIGFISRWAVKTELAARALAAVEIPGLKITRQFYAVCRQPLIPACVRDFWDFLGSRAAKNG